MPPTILYCANPLFLGPIEPEEGIRFWVTLDSTPSDYGSPVYLKGSRRNTVVPPEAVFVDINMPGLESYKDSLESFVVEPGDMIVWHPKTIHKIDGPADGIWDTYRRVLGGTVAKGGSFYHDRVRLLKAARMMYAVPARSGLVARSILAFLPLHSYRACNCSACACSHPVHTLWHLVERDWRGFERLGTPWAGGYGRAEVAVFPADIPEVGRRGGGREGDGERGQESQEYGVEVGRADGGGDAGEV